MPERLRQLRAWLEHDCAIPSYQIVPASGDASFRRYFRVTTPTASLIVMDAPPDKEDCRPFLQVAQLLERAGVHVPHIHAHDLHLGFMLLEDLGDRLYLGELDDTTVDIMYGAAIGSLLQMQEHAEGAGLPCYDEALLTREMALFPEWLLKHHLGLDLDSATEAMLARSFATLCRSALEQPKVCVHRDYHSRNLLVCAPHSPGVIDFQDAVYGPLSYDLVSLLRDCYVAWPPQRVDTWAMDYARQAVASGILAPADLEHFLYWFDLMGAQRHLKAAGIFARLHHRDGKPGYLADIPRTLGYIVTVAQRRSELADLGGFIEQQVLIRL